jgi:predicted esterase
MLPQHPLAQTPVTTWGSEIGQARAAVIAVHGRGQSPAFMRAQAQRLDSTRIRFYSPTAPGQTWYPRPFLEALEHNEPDLSRSLDALESLVAEVEADGFPRDRIVLWGFSQGACLISHLVLTRPSRYGALALLTGGFVGPDILAARDGSPLEGTPAVMRSIEHDPWVPKYRVEQTANALSKVGAAVDLVIAPGDEHIITDEAMTAVDRLLQSI